MSLNTTWRRLPSPSVTPNELLEILTAHNNGYYVLPIEPYDEVYPGIILGDSTTALCLHLLKRLQVTHVLNTAWGKQRNLGMVNTSAGYYRSVSIQFMGVEALDMTVFPLFHYFFQCADFIDQALRSDGKVLVHCGEGISRSSTTVIAYLMIKQGFDVKKAVATVVKHRNILPNQGFLLQLCQLNDQLKTMAKSEREAATSPASSLRESSISPISPITFGASVRNEYRSTQNVDHSISSSSRPSARTLPTPNYLSPTSYGSTTTSPSATNYRRSRSPSPFRSKYQPSMDLSYTSRNVTPTGNAHAGRSYRSQSVERSYPSTLSSARYEYSNSGGGGGGRSTPQPSARYYRSSLMSSYLSPSSYR